MVQEGIREVTCVRTATLVPSLSRSQGVTVRAGQAFPVGKTSTRPSLSRHVGGDVESGHDRHVVHAFSGGVAQ